ncbi:MAG: molybdopterin molybdenumtransferase MoeA, partial [Deltaproteobacteria bacterium]|nr:molybdopterin molybdenumtransferase MoeA [Deltaproteobacteria bacterium]
MLSFEQARQVILENSAPVGIEQVTLLESVGRVLPHDLITPWDMPRWDNSAMDGYAVRCADCRQVPCTLKVSGYLPAGASGYGVTVEPGCAVRIMTGAPSPAGCDAIVPVEETDEGQLDVTLLHPVIKGQHVRLRGEDVASGTVFVRGGTIVRPPEVNILA